MKFRVQLAGSFSKLLEPINYDSLLSLLLRKPLLLLFVLGCGVSAAASGRFSVRLVLDGAVSFAFLPAIELIALAVVNAAGSRRRQPFARSVDQFFAGNRPWLIWIVGVSAALALLRPRGLGTRMTLFVLSAIVPFAYSCLVDFRFFRDVAGRSPRGAMADLLLNRAIGWPMGIAYFFGIAIWSGPLPEFLRWIGL